MGRRGSKSRFALYRGVPIRHAAAAWCEILAHGCVAARYAPATRRAHLRLRAIPAYPTDMWRKVRVVDTAQFRMTCSVAASCRQHRCRGAQTTIVVDHTE